MYIINQEIRLAVQNHAFIKSMGIYRGFCWDKAHSQGMTVDCQPGVQRSDVTITLEL